MEISMIQLAAAALTFALTSAAPSNLGVRQSCDDIESPTKSSISVGAGFVAMATKRPKANANKHKATKSKATKTKESKDKAPKDKEPKDKEPKDKQTKDKAPKGKTPKAKAPKDKADKAKPTKAKGGGKVKPTRPKEKDTPDPTRGSKPGGGSGGGGSGDSPAPTPAGRVTPISGGGSSGGEGRSSVLAGPQTIAAGGSFDGGGATFDRGVPCTGQVEGSSEDAVFVIQSGGSLSNVVIGLNQIEGVHCYGACKVTNVSWTAVCEDAFTIKEQAAEDTTTITGGSSKGATDKVFQFNGAGTLSISGFNGDGFGTFARSCGNCRQSAKRHIIIDGVTASNGRDLCGINTNFGDTCKITNTKLSSVKYVCLKYNGVGPGNEPPEIGSGADGKNCIYDSDVTGAG